MISQMPDLLTLILTFSLILIVGLKIVRNHKKTDSIPNIPPGPWKLPIIGTIHHMLTFSPHKKLRDLANIYGPMMHLQLGEVFTIIVSSPEYAKEIMKTHDVIFASRPYNEVAKTLAYESSSIAAAPCGNYWRVLRKISTMELLSQKRVNSFQQIREEELANIIKVIDSQKGSIINLTQILSSIYSITSRSAFGKKYKDQEEFISLLKEVAPVAAIDAISSARWLQLVTRLRSKLERLHQKIDRILENIIIEHKLEAKSRAKEGQGEQMYEDFVDILLKFQDGNDTNKEICLTNDNIKAIILDIFIGGGETTTITIDWAMAEMVRDQRVMKKAQAEVREVFKLKGRVDDNCINELKYLKLVVKETLRLHPPVPLLIPRECGQASEIDGYHIPIKSRVLVNVWAIGRDPKYWSEPEKFYPERFIDNSIDYRGNNFEYIPFGAGRRICPGYTFGLQTIEVSLAFLLYHFDWKLPNGIKNEHLDMTEKFGVSLKRKYDLYLIPCTSSLVPTM